MDYQEIRDLLPTDSRTALDEIWNQTGGSDARLNICIAGAFSTGKTSLLNYLIGKSILPVALEESTTLPTFLEYSATPHYRLAFDDSVQEIEEKSIAATITSPPKGARLLDIGLPLAWLRGIEIIDLPGTGSMDSVKREYGQEVMRQADAVVYLLASRGPSKSDLEDLRTLYLLGKKVFLGVSHWDQVQEAIAQGEQEPDLKSWAREIEYNCGISAPLVPVDRRGTGASEVLSFLGAAVEGLQDVRLTRFRAEAAPTLANLLAAHSQAIETLNARSEEEIRTAHQSLMREKEALLQMRQKAYQRQREENGSILAQWDKECQTLEKRLGDDLAGIAEKWLNPDGQEDFLQGGKNLVRQALEEAAVIGRNISQNYGSLDLPVREMEQRGITLAPPPSLEVGEFLDMGRYTMLEERLRQAEAKKTAAMKPQADMEAVKVDISEHHRKLQELENNRRQLAAQPVPQYVETVAGNGSGGTLGRAIGEVADIALFFVTPPVAAAKVATIIGKAGKAVGMSAKAAKAAGQIAATTTKTAVNLHRTGCGKSSPGKGISEKLGKLEVLTLGYWCEKIGSAFDSAPRQTVRIDRQALAEREQDLRSIQAEMQKQKLELLALERELNAPGADTAAINAEIAGLRQEMADMEARAQQKKAQTEDGLKQDYQAMLAYEKTKCLKEWLRFFNVQTQAMRSLLAAMLKNWWEGYLPELLGEKERQVDSLLRELNELPSRRKEREEQLRKETANIEAAKRLLHEQS